MMTNVDLILPVFVLVELSPCVKRTTKYDDGGENKRQNCISEDLRVPSVKFKINIYVYIYVLLSCKPSVKPESLTFCCT